MLTVSENIRPDTCNKIRLRLDSLVLNVLNDSGDIESSIDAQLVANGKIDLKPSKPFTILPGETLFVSLDFDVDRSLKITETENGKVIIRPVIFVKVGGYPGHKNGLTRVSGIIDEISADTSAMRICMDELTAQPISTSSTDVLPERCLLVGLDSDTGVFGQDGLPIQANELVVDDPVMVVGLLAVADDHDMLQSTTLASVASNDSGSDQHGDSDDHHDDSDGDSDSGSDSDSDGDSDGDSDSDGGSGPPPALPFVLEAIVVERGPPGNFLQLAGTLQSGVDPQTDTYEMLIAPEQGFAPDSVLTGKLFAQSRIIDRDGMDIDRSLLQTEDRAIADGVLLLKNNDVEANALRTALMIVRQGDPTQPPEPEEDILIGKILSIDKQTFRIATETTDRCVNGIDATVLFLVESEGSLEVIKGTMDDLIEGLAVIIFGTESDGGCFDADLIISRGAYKPPETS